MATLKLALDKRRTKKDGTYPIVFKLTVKSKQAIISTGVCVLENEFCDKSGLVTSSPKLSMELVKLDSIYRARFHDYVINNHDAIDVNVLKTYILNKPKAELTVHEFWEETIVQLRTMKRYGSMKNYEQALRTISSEINLQIPFKSLQYKDLVQLEGKLIQRGMSYNGMAVYLRAFRAVCNRAIKEDIVGYDWYPFRKFVLKKSKTTPRVLSIDEMKLYFSLNYSTAHPHYRVWNIGKLLFLLRGINLKDLLLLKPQDIKHGRVLYKRCKTGKLYSIMLTEEILECLSHFATKDTILGIVSKDKVQSAKSVEYFRQQIKNINNTLKRIGKEAGFDEALSTYVFRYSYANIAKQLGFSKDLIAEALGHEYGNRVTGIYLEQFDLSYIDEMNSVIITHVKQVPL